MATLQEQLVKYLTDAHGMEQQSLRSLQVSAKHADDPQLKQLFQQHARETEIQRERLETVLAAHGAKPSAVKDAGNQAISLGKGLLDSVRTDNAGKEVRDAYIGEAMEIVSYELLKRVAQRAGAQDAVQVAEANLAEERAAQQQLEGVLDLAVERSLQVETAS